MAAAEDQDARRRRLVAAAKAEAEAIKLEKLQRGEATAAERERWTPRPKAATVDEAAAQIREQEAAATPARDPSVSDGIRDRGTRELQAGIQLYSEADRKRSVKVRNKDYESTRDYTNTMGAGQAVGRRGLFSPGSVALAPPPAQPPVQVVVQAPGAPPPAPPAAQPAPAAVDPLQAAPGAAPAAPAARAVPGGAVGVVPGQLPTAPLGAVPLEGEPPPDETPEQELARLEAEAAGIDPAALEAQAAADYGPMDGAGEPMGPGVPEGAMPRGGLLQQQLDAREMQANAVVGEQTEAALALRDAADQARMSLDEAAAAKAEADARLEQELEASQAANRVVADLTAKAREMGPIDNRRAFKNMGIGKRILFGIQIALSSFGGRSQAEAHAGINRAIEDDIEDQRNELAKIGSDIDAARAVAGDRANLLQQARSVVGDEQTAQDVVRVARLEQVKAELEARMAAAGIARVGSEQEVLLNTLEQEIAAKKMTIDQAAARNPQYFTKSVNVYGKGTREGMKLAGKNLIESGAGAGEMADEQAGKLELEGEKGRLDQVLQQQKQAAKAGDKVAEQAWKFAEKTERLQSMNRRIDQLLALDDIPGYGYTEGVDSSGKLDTDQLLELIIEDYGRIQSQGAIGAEERVAFREQVYKGVKFSDGRLLEGSEERLRKNLEGLKQGATFRMEGLQRALPEETSSYYDRVAAPAQFDARFAGSTSADVVEED